MATMQATTVSDGVVVTDVEAVAQLCETYDFGLLDWTITSDDVFSIRGYDSFELYHTDEEGLPDYGRGIVTKEFLLQLSGYIACDDQLDIQCVGHTKLRFPATAFRYVVSTSEVHRAGLNHLELVVIDDD